MFYINSLIETSQPPRIVYIIISFERWGSERWGNMLKVIEPAEDTRREFSAGLSDRKEKKNTLLTTVLPMYFVFSYTGAE